MKVEPKKPDLVFYSEERDEWRFCEVKGKYEPVRAGQLEGLAVLHLITAAPVAIVRVVPEPPKGNVSVSQNQYWEVTLKFKKDAQLDWIHSKVRKLLRRKFKDAFWY